jgi:hypothetical protein
MPENFGTPGRRIVILHFAFCILHLFLLPCIAQAQVFLSLPLDGYYRPNHYMPVQISRVGEGFPDTPVFLHAEGAIDLSVPIKNTRSQVVLPWLIFRTPTQIHWSLGPLSKEVDLSFKPLGENDRLVGYTADFSAIAAKLFPGKNIIPIHLDSARPLPGDAAAWESLDGLIVDLSVARRLSSRQRDVLLASGTLLAVQSGDPPDSQWNWQRVDQFWILRPVDAPPVNLISDVAYLPTYDWMPGQPAFLRQQIFLAAVVFSILALAIALLGGRWRLVLTFLLVLLSLPLIHFWGARQFSVWQITGGVVLWDDAKMLEDRWTWQTSMQSSDAVFSYAHLSRPVFYSEVQRRQAEMKLNCTAEGNPIGFTYHLNANARQAFLSRSVIRSIPTFSPGQLSASPFGKMVEQMYRTVDSQFAGQISSSSNYPTLYFRLNENKK